MFKLERIENDIFSSNCYIYYNEVSQNAIIIDPGSINVKNILAFVETKRLSIDYMFLTHSHFDHIAGVPEIKKMNNAPIVCSTKCGQKIVNPKKNLSIFSEFGEVICPSPDILIEDRDRFLWKGVEISCYSTCGHSDCSIIISFDNKLFTGDTLLKGIKSLAVKPDGNKEELKNSLDFIYSKFEGSTEIWPGHGDSFFLREQDIKIAFDYK